MSDLKNKDVLVIGLGGRGCAACELLCRSGARVVAIDSADTPDLRDRAARLRSLGVDAALGVSTPPKGNFTLAVLNPAVPAASPLVQPLVAADLPIVSELKLGFQRANCLTVAIAGTNGKSTAAELVERILLHNHRSAILCGHRARPICAVADQTRDVDFLIFQTSSFQLEFTRSLRPAVAVLLNLTADHLNRYPNPAGYARASARLFLNQQVFDWAIVQSEALAHLRQLELPVPAKIITFSASDPKADLHLDRLLLISRIPSWSGPLLDIDHCELRGPHNAENHMAALAVGHALRLPLDAMVDLLKTYTAGLHRFELVAEFNGVQFINDSKATNLDALHKALLATRAGHTGEPNVWLIAGGQNEDSDFHDLGLVLSKRVKHAFLIGESSEKIRAAWSLFTPCKTVSSLLEAIAEAARSATSGEVILLSPACSSFDQFRDYQERGETFCRAVKSIGSGAAVGATYIHGITMTFEQVL